jgi:hypothetical protein
MVVTETPENDPGSWQLVCLAISSKTPRIVLGAMKTSTASQFSMNRYKVAALGTTNSLNEMQNDSLRTVHSIGIRTSRQRFLCDNVDLAKSDIAGMTLR